MTRGDLINARATAGAALVDARERLARTSQCDVAAHKRARVAVRGAEFRLAEAEAAEKAGAAGNAPGFLLVFEGPGGSGKSAQAAIHAARSIDSVLQREPTEGPIGATIRALLRGAARVEDPLAIQALFAADRIDHAPVLRTYLQSGYTVVCDRFALSSCVYGAAMAGEHVVPWVRAINELAPRPDLTIVFDVSVETCATRLAARAGADIYDVPELQRRVHDLYRRAEQLVPDERVVHVDGEGSIAEVAERVAAAVAEARA